MDRQGNMKALTVTLLSALAMAWPAAQGPSVKQIEAADKKVAAMLRNAPKPVDLDIEYRPIRGMEDQSQWHIGASHWWVRLHHSTGTITTTNLDKKKKYRVTGVVLEQNYGTVEVWLDHYREIE
jgi:hypothetical protein